MVVMDQSESEAAEADSYLLTEHYDKNQVRQTVDQWSGLVQSTNQQTIKPFKQS